MTRTHRIQDSLATIGALFADYHQRHFAPTGQPNRDTTIGYIRYDGATPYSPPWASLMPLPTPR